MTGGMSVQIRGHQFPFHIYGGKIRGMLWDYVQAIWLQNFITKLGFVDMTLKPLKIYYDNSVADSFSQITFFF
jgi:hypothetical protein